MLYSCSYCSGFVSLIDTRARGNAGARPSETVHKLQQNCISSSSFSRIIRNINRRTTAAPARRQMKRMQTYRRWLFAPLVYLAALFLLSEEWLGRTGARLTRGWAEWPPLHALERRITALPPYAALTVFVL